MTTAVTERRVVTKDVPDPERAQWLERVAAATEAAITELGQPDDPAHRALLEDLQAFHDRLFAELGR